LSGYNSSLVKEWYRFGGQDEGQEGVQDEGYGEGEGVSAIHG
jgi:hypothetical protein